MLYPRGNAYDNAYAAMERKKMNLNTGFDLLFWDKIKHVIPDITKINGNHSR